MNDLTDQQLLSDYGERRSEAAFAELVRRHLDLVYSAAYRLTGQPHAAQDVAQGVFLALAQQAGELSRHPVLTGWLHTTTRNLAAKTIRAAARRQLHEQEATVMNELLAAPEASWEELAPHLDAALGELSDTDRDAVLLRYFEKKSAREMAAVLGISDEAAQKRVNRAVDRLRAILARHKVSLGASGLVVLLTANAVQAAPVGLAAAISTAALASVTVSAVTATAGATQTLTMTTLQKSLVTATVAVLAGVGIYETQQSAKLNEQVRTLQQQQAPLIEQVRQLQAQLAGATNRLAALIAENARLNSNPQQAELLRLRGEVTRLRQDAREFAALKASSEQPALATAQEYYERADAHGARHEFELQLQDLNKAIELDPKLANAYRDRAMLYANHLPKSRGGNVQVLADYTRYLELKPRDASFRHNRALHYEQSGQIDNAIADYTIVIQGDLDFEGDKQKLISLDYYYRGRLYQGPKKNYAQAIADYTAALALDPQIEGAHRRRGECYEKLGEVAKAQLDFAIEPKRE